MARQTILLLLQAVTLTVASDASRPHPHQGILSKYERKHPSEYGLTMRGISGKQLRTKTICRMLRLPNGYKRCTAIREVKAPADLIFSRILDLGAYPRMIAGVKRCDVYHRKLSSLTGAKTICAKYRVRELGFTMEAFMAHEIEFGRRCMTFSLDYSRCSDLSDTVGYWYVEKVCVDANLNPRWQALSPPRGNPGG